MSNKKRIAIFTGSRSEYGLLIPIIRAIDAHKDLEYHLIGFVSPNDELGVDLSEVESSGFDLGTQIHFTFKKSDYHGVSSIVPADVVAIMGGVIEDMAWVLARENPDILLVYGDRYEAFSAVIAGTQMNIPTVHMEGGDITMGGALDDSVRHAMTKLSHIHLVTNEQSKERVLKLGEEEWRVHNVGYPAIDLIKAKEYATEEEIYKKYHIKVNRPLVVCIQHSVTTEWECAAEQVKPTLEALKQLSVEGIQVIILYPCNDAGGKAIVQEIEHLLNIPNIQIHKNLPRGHFHGLLNICGKYQGVCVGNSSSFIKEAVSFGVPVVNVGTRQEGRMRGNNVADVGYDKDDILETVEEGLNYHHAFTDNQNPYANGNTGKTVASLLADLSLDKKLLQKRMTY